MLKYFKHWVGHCKIYEKLKQTSILNISCQSKKDLSKTLSSFDFPELIAIVLRCLKNQRGKKKYFHIKNLSLRKKKVEKINSYTWKC